MAEVRVTCPMCNSELAIGEEHLGKEIECGSCLQPFVAEDPKTKKQPYKMRRTENEDRDDDDDRPRKKKKRRRRDDDDDDYDYSPPGESGGGSGLGTASLVLGLTSLIPTLMCCCAPLSTMAAGVMQLAGLVCGSLGLKSPTTRGMAIAGLVVNGFAIVLNVLLLAGLFAPMAQRWNIK